MSCLIPPLVAGSLHAAEPAKTWPHPIPCRIADGPNPELMVMTLGSVEPSIAQGSFDPAKDEVTLKDGTVKPRYYQDTLGVKFYQPLDKTRFPLPPSGWCSWYYYYTRVNSAEIRLNTDWIAENLKDFGAQWVQIDDGWQGNGSQSGIRDWSTVNTTRFPEGMAAMAAHIKSRGLTPGLWLAPHGQSNEEVVKQHPGLFLMRPDGTSASDTWEGKFLLDPTAPGTPAYLDSLFSKLTGWGYEYFKIDGQPIVADEYANKGKFMKSPGHDATALYRQTLGQIRKTIGPDRFLLGCWGTPIEGANIYNGSRTGGDVVLGWSGFLTALQATIPTMHLHNIVWYGDPDVLLVRAPLTLDQARVWAALQGLTGQALLSSDRLPDLPDERVELLRRVYPAADIRPLDLFPTTRNKTIWDLKINHLGRNYDVVGVFNFRETTARSTYLAWDDLGLPHDQPMHVFDFWNREYLGAFKGGMMVENAPTSCRVLTLVPATDRIELVSTSRHMTQGWTDLVSLQPSPDGSTWSGRSKTVKNDPYQLRFAFPVGKFFAVSAATASVGGKELPVTIRNHQGWSSVTLTSPTTAEVDWNVSFSPAGHYPFPPSAPEELKAFRNPDGSVLVRWKDQYYLNQGYQLYLNGRIMGYSPSSSFLLNGLNPAADCQIEVRSLWQDGAESPTGKSTLSFQPRTLAATPTP